MSLPNSLRAYEDCKALFEAALADPKGARALGGTYEACLRLRTRMHYYRKLDRDANAEVYAVDHPMHGHSIYDPYVCQIVPDEDSQHWLYVSPITAQSLHIEGISDGGELLESNPTDTEAHEVHLLEDKSNA